MAKKYGVELICYDKEHKAYYVRSKRVSINTDYGKIDESLLKDVKNGDILKTSKDEPIIIVKPSFLDKYKSMKRGAQSIKLKDCAAILAETLVGKDSVCLDCGAGMGGLTCFLARYVKKVYSCDYKKEHLENSRFNSELVGLKNIKFIECDIYKGLPVKTKLDLITLDLINPELVLDDAKKQLNAGGFIVAYCPQATQMQVFTNTAKEKGFLVTKSMEVNQREWKIEGLVVRPEHIGLQHTAFLVFAKKIW